MDEDFDKLIEQFMENHADLFREAKWCLFMDIIRNAKNDPGDAVVEMMLKFIQVFRKHDVDPDIVIEAFAVLGEAKLPSKKQESNDISSSDLTSFIKVLNDIQKKKGENNE